jgi:hypothetical protein
MKREERRANHYRHREFAKQELENPNSSADFDSGGPMWNDLWTETTSDDTEQFSLSLFIFYLNIIFESYYQTIYQGKVFAGGVFRAVHAVSESSNGPSYWTWTTRMV